MNKRSLLMCACALSAIAAMGCNESVDWEKAPVCGNGIIEVGEICDVSVSDKLGCAYFDPSKTWAAGKPGCSADCKLTQGSCVASTAVVNNCGNGVIDAGEACDGANYNGKSCIDYVGEGASGSLACIGCQINSTNCKAAVPSTCGNGVKDEGEDCDGSVPAELTCAAILGEGATGSVTCTSDCHIDQTGCSLAGGAFCGNGVVEGTEKCDGDQFAPNLDGASCGSAYGSNGPVDGVAKCSATCEIDLSECKYCGDGQVNVAGEECDGTVDPAMTCEVATGIAGSTGTVKCTGCKLDKSECKDPTTPSSCGNDAIDAGEECDGTNLNNHSCEVDVPGSTGTVTCDANCRIVTTACVAAPKCGDGIINGDDECEGNDFGGKTCATELGDGATGSLSCNNCKIDTSDCEPAVAPDKCGNGTLDAGEECDGTNYNGKTCADYAGQNATGSLSCVSCKIVSSACKAAPICGDKKVDTGEECDGSVPSDVTCDSKIPGSEGKVVCSTECKYDFGACTAQSTGDYPKTYTIVLPGENYKDKQNVYTTSVTNYVVDGNVKYSATGNYSYETGLAITTNEKHNNFIEITGFTGVGTLTISGTGWDTSGQYTITAGSTVKELSLGTIKKEAFSSPFEFNAADATKIRIEPKTKTKSNGGRVYISKIEFTAKK